MPDLTEHRTSEILKLILIGASGSGKTSALASLVPAGYELFIMDFDNLLSPLVRIVQENWPNRLSQVRYLPFQDKMKKVGTALVLDGAPTAMINALDTLTEWKEGDVSFGFPSQWGPKRVLVIDSLSSLATAAMNWGRFYGVTGQQRDYYPAIVGEAQRMIVDVLSLMRSDAFHTNVIVIAHVQYLTLAEGQMKGVPFAPGDKLSPKIPEYFDTMLRVMTEGFGREAKKVIRLRSDAFIDVKSPVALGMQEESLPLSTGLATVFSKYHKQGETK